MDSSRANASPIFHQRPTGQRWVSGLVKLLAPVAAWTVIFSLAVLSAAAEPSPPANSPEEPGHRTFLPLTDINTSTALAAQPGLQPSEIRTYVLNEGDDLTDLALELGRDVTDMACVTPSGTYPLSQLRPGQTIVVPAPIYACHIVQGGETLPKIAERYQVTPEAIVEIAWNDLPSLESPLVEGQRLLIYGGQRPDPALLRQNSALSLPSPEGDTAATGSEPVNWPYGDGQFIWPVSGSITQGYHLNHKAIDIGVDRGTPVLAADNGVVIKAGWSEIGYGWRVVIDHNIDFITLYAHLDNYFVEEGDTVEKGQVIGISGSTGHSTGPHVHFELRDFGYLVDPVPLLHEHETPSTSDTSE